MGSWVNTNAQVLDFTFQLDVPLHADNAMYIAGLYFDYADYDPTYDYETYMSEMDEMSKYEVHFKCVKAEEPTPEPTAEITTMEQTTNSFYVNGLDQECLIKIFSGGFNCKE